MRLKKFISSTDYTTLKNDSELVSVSATIPASTAVGAGATVTYTGDVTVGTAGSPMLVTVREPINSRYLLYAGPIQYVYISGPDQLQGFVTVFKTSATNVRIKIDLYNGGGAPVNTEGVTRTFTAYIRTYLPPFS